MDSWGQFFQQLGQHTAPKRRLAIKSLATEAASAVGDAFEQPGLADLPAPAGGLVPPTLATGLPGVGPAVGDGQLGRELVRWVAHTSGSQTLPEFRCVVGEWMQRHAAQLPADAKLQDMLCELVEPTYKQRLADQRKRQRDAKAGGQADGWLNPLASHRFGPPLQTAQSDDTASRPDEIENLRAWLSQPQGLHRLRTVLFANLLCVHLAVRADAPSDCTPAVVQLLMRTATRLLQAIALHTDDDTLGDNAAAIATELARHGSAPDGFPTLATAQRAAAAAGLPRPFRPCWFGSPDSLLLTARHALAPEHHAWLEATAWLARDTAHLITSGLLAPQLQLLGREEGLLLDGLYEHLQAQKDSLRKAKRRDFDATDPFQQVMSKPMYLHRIWQHLGFLLRARHALCTAAERLPPSKLAGLPVNLKG